MKIKVTIEEITHEDLVNLFSTSLYGSSTFCADFDSNEWDALKEGEKNGECFEDKMASLLLNGKTITIYDMEAQDEEDFYSKNKVLTKWDEENQWMGYILSLKDIIRGLEKALQSDDQWANKCANHLCNSPEDLDLYEGEALLQMCCFGDVVYG